MKILFDAAQPFQLDAIRAVVDVFASQQYFAALRLKTGIYAWTGSVAKV